MDGRDELVMTNSAPADPTALLTAVHLQYGMGLAANAASVELLLFDYDVASTVAEERRAISQMTGADGYRHRKYP